MPAATCRPSTRILLLCCSLLVLLLQGQVAGGQLLMLQLQRGVLGTQRLEVLVGGCNLCMYGSQVCILTTSVVLPCNRRPEQEQKQCMYATNGSLPTPGCTPDAVHPCVVVRTCSPSACGKWNGAIV